MLRKIVLLSMFCAAPAFANSALNYTYADAGFSSTTLKAGNSSVRFGGIYGEGSFDFGNGMIVGLNYSDGKKDGVTTSTWDGALGYVATLNRNSDFIFKGHVGALQVENDFDKQKEDYVAISVGARSYIAENFEVNAAIKLYHFSDIDDEYSFRIGVRQHLTSNISVGADFEKLSGLDDLDDTTFLRVGIRYQF